MSIIVASAAITVAVGGSFFLEPENTDLAKVSAAVCRDSVCEVLHRTSFTKETGFAIGTIERRFSDGDGDHVQTIRLLNRTPMEELRAWVATDNGEPELKRF